MFRKTFAALAVAVVALVASPVAAIAAPSSSCAGVKTEGYANGVTVTVDSPTVGPGGTVQVVWSDGYFVDSSPVTIEVEGNNAAEALIETSTGSGSGSLATTASATGGLTASVTLPTNATGSYAITAVSTQSCGGVEVSVVNPAGTGSGAEVLAFTGGTLPVVLIVTGAGALVFGAILLMVRIRARRHLHE